MEYGKHGLGTLNRRSPDLSDAQAFFRSTKGETMMAQGKPSPLA
jgi:hypothetical protein